MDRDFIGIDGPLTFNMAQNIFLNKINNKQLIKEIKQNTFENISVKCPK